MDIEKKFKQGLLTEQFRTLASIEDCTEKLENYKRKVKQCNHFIKVKHVENNILSINFGEFEYNCFILKNT